MFDSLRHVVALLDREGRITEAQADRIRKDLPKILNRLGKGPRFHRGPGGPPPGFRG